MEEYTQDQPQPLDKTLSVERVSRTVSSVHDITAEKPPFGARFLTEESDVWSQNAWDHVPPPDDQVETIAASLAKQRLAPVPDVDKPKYNEKPARHWDNFYKMNQNNFFRNRKWLHLEFPELVHVTEPKAGPITIAEIGCGAGNAVFPLLESNKNPELSLYAYDYSSHAVKLVQTHPLYHKPPIGTIHSAIWDLSSPYTLPPGIEPESVDIVILIFIMSALHPDEWGRAIANVHKMLKPGGRVLFRDYGRHDLTQLRFKSGRLLSDNFYIRGDKTRVYFFELDELALLFTGSTVPMTRKTPETTHVLEDEAITPVHSTYRSLPDSGGLVDLDSGNSAPLGPNTHATVSESPLIIHPNLTPSADGADHPLFAIDQLGVDRRLLVNRKRQLKMYRVWMQGKFQKLPCISALSN